MSVKAAGDICRARYKGASVGSSSLYFEPGEVKVGKYHFSIGTAGATGLVLHAVYLPLALRGAADSELTNTGGTHISTSPCFHYNATTWAAYLQRMGIEVALEMSRPGFYPRGGGEIRATVRPCSRVRELRLMDCPELTTAGGFSAVAGLVERQQDIARRQARRVGYRLKTEGVESHVLDEYWLGGPGTVVAAILRQAPVPTLFFSVGERGKRT
jgi:RNA 3'-terminal phosphate cyclase (ATP)